MRWAGPRGITAVSVSLYEIRQIQHEPMTMIEKRVWWNEAVIRARWMNAD